MAVKPIPDGYHTATPYLIAKGAASRHAFIAHCGEYEDFVQGRLSPKSRLSRTFANRPPLSARFLARVRSSQWPTERKIRSSTTAWIEAAISSRLCP